MERIIDIFTDAGFQVKSAVGIERIDLSRGDMSFSIEKTSRGMYCLTMDNLVVYFSRVERSPSGLCLILWRNSTKVGLIDLPGMVR